MDRGTLKGSAPPAHWLRRAKPASANAIAYADCRPSRACVLALLLAGCQRAPQDEPSRPAPVAAADTGRAAPHPAG